mgnify:CR=1 FL=1
MRVVVDEAAEVEMREGSEKRGGDSGVVFDREVRDVREEKLSVFLASPHRAQEIYETKVDAAAAI